MRRGITSTIRFTLPSEISVSNLIDARITIKQIDCVCADHALKDMKLDTEENALKLQLLQEETLRLDARREAEIQLKVKLRGGTVLATPIYYAKVNEILNEEVI
jgi:hypothetical protein